MVDWKPLHTIVKSVSTGLNPRKNFILNEESATLFYVTVKEITTNRILFSDSTDRITEKAKQVINNRSKLREGDILFSGIGTIGKVAYVDIPTNNWDCSESVFLIKPNDTVIRGKFLAYILSSDIAKKQYERGSSGAIMKGVRKATLESLQIPLPSLSEQQRIVGILDTFTASIDNLKEQIAQRRKQYEYYRDQLLDLEGKPGVEMKTLGEICDTLSGFPFDSTKFRDFGIQLMRGANIKRGFFDFSPDLNKYWESSAGLEKYLLEANDIIISMDGSLVGKSFCYLRSEHLPLLLVQRVARIRTKGNYKYLYYYITKSFPDYVDKKKTAGAIPHISMKDINSFIVPLPSFREQSRIVGILGTFEASIQNLEAQLKEREKQYEYYRNKLLTFE